MSNRPQGMDTGTCVLMYILTSWRITENSIFTYLISFVYHFVRIIRPRTGIFDKGIKETIYFHFPHNLGQTQTLMSDFLIHLNEMTEVGLHIFYSEVKNHCNLHRR